MLWKEEIIRMLNFVNDERVLRRVWRLLYRAWMG